MEEVEAGEVEDDAGLKHRKPQRQQQQAEKATATVLDSMSGKQHLKDPATPMLASKTVPKGTKRAPVKRTREQEKEAYGRVFVGCGRKED